MAEGADGPDSRPCTGSGSHRPTHLLVAERTRFPPQGVRTSTAPVTGGTVQVVVPGDQMVEVRQEPAVKDTHPWSPAPPVLPHADVRLTVSGEPADSDEAESGIRAVTVDVGRGLQIDCTPVTLRGTCTHLDDGVIGAPSLPAADERGVRIPADSGSTPIPSAHDPASRSFRQACDRLGVLVLEELTDAGTRSTASSHDGQDFAQWWERDLEALVAEDVDHPSVLVCSTGNQIAETATTGSTDTDRALADEGCELDPIGSVTDGIDGFLDLVSPQDEEEPARTAEVARQSGDELTGVLDLVLGIFDRTVEHLPHVIGDPARTGGDHVGEAGPATEQHGTTERQIHHDHAAVVPGEWSSTPPASAGPDLPLARSLGTSPAVRTSPSNRSTTPARRSSPPGGGPRTPPPAGAVRGARGASRPSRSPPTPRASPCGRTGAPSAGPRRARTATTRPPPPSRTRRAS